MNMFTTNLYARRLQDMSEILWWYYFDMFYIYSQWHILENVRFNDWSLGENRKSAIF